MLGRVYPGRLPSTTDEIAKVNKRISKVTRDLNAVSNLVANGTISSGEAHYRRAFLKGEVDQLNQYKNRIRMSTPSYNIPLDIFETTKRRPHPGARKPAKKYVSEDYHTQATIPTVKTYFKRGRKSKVKKVPSEWQATTITDSIDVPDISPSKVGPGVTGKKWPKHWPGNHSSLIEKEIKKASRIHNRLMIDVYRDPSYRIRMDTRDPSYQSLAAQLESMWKILKGRVTGDVRFTKTDHRLVNEVLISISNQIKRTTSGGDSTGDGLPPPQEGQPGVPPHLQQLGGAVSFSMAKRTGLGAMQYHDRHRWLRDEKPNATSAQQASFNADRELLLTTRDSVVLTERQEATSSSEVRRIKEESVERAQERKQDGAKIDITKPLPSMIPPSPPLPPMIPPSPPKPFTPMPQSMPQPMGPPMHMIQEEIRMLTRDRVPIEAWPPHLLPYAPRYPMVSPVHPMNQEIFAQPMGLGSALLKTRDAMGRLLG